MGRSWYYHKKEQFKILNFRKEMVDNLKSEEVFIFIFNVIHINVFISLNAQPAHENRKIFYDSSCEFGCAD